MKIKVNEWLKRYFPAEIISMILTIVSAELAFYFTQNNIATALIATLIGNTVYFACILLSDIQSTRKQCLINKQEYTQVIFYKNIKALFVEFGLAEVIDTLLIRPFLMGTSNNSILKNWCLLISIGCIHKRHDKSN